MAEVLKEFKFKGRGGQSSYPWEEWADGRVWRITQGDLANTTPVIFRKSLTSVAQRLGLKVRTTIDGDAVVFQFYKADQ